MKTAGIDIGTTTISGVVLEKEENGQAKILEAKTVENGCFIETGNEWERIQYAKEIVERAVNLLDYFLEKYPHVERIGLTGQMHGIVYVDKEGNCVSPLYTWQDVRGSICDGDQIPLTEEIRERCQIHAASGYGLVTHIYNIRHNLVPDSALSFCTIMDYFGMYLTGRKKPLVHVSNAAGFGFFDSHKMCFEKEKLAQGVIEKLSDVWKKYIHIQVKDNGCGMDKETLRQIFDPFFTTKKGGEGTGLGLALAEQIITSHKGYIYAESKKGEGSTFHIYLPVLDTEHMPQIVQNIPRKDYRIVVADDNAKVLQLLKKNFEKIGIQIQTCMKREELQKCLEQQEADVLVVDETMEDCSGVDFCMSLAGRYPDMLKLIIIDGVSREVAEARQKGIIDGYAEKPVSDTAILEAIRNRASQPV